MAQKSNSVLKELGPKIAWVESYVTDEKINCVYRATNAEITGKHAEKGGAPADWISEVRSVINPTNGE